MWTLSTMATCVIIVCAPRLTGSQDCYIPPGHSSLADVGRPPLRLSVSPLVAIQSWGTPLLETNDSYISMELCPQVSLVIKTAPFNVTDKSLCAQILGDFVRCDNNNKQLALGTIEGFGTCDPRNGEQGVHVQMIISWHQLINQTTKLQCFSRDLPGVNLLHVTITKIGCPVGYWGNQCDKKCSCLLSTQDCHTVSGACLPPRDFTTTTTTTTMTRTPSRVVSYSEFSTKDVTTTKNRRSTTQKNHSGGLVDISMGTFLMFTISTLITAFQW